VAGTRIFLARIDTRPPASCLDVLGFFIRRASGPRTPPPADAASWFHALGKLFGSRIAVDLVGETRGYSEHVTEIRTPARAKGMGDMGSQLGGHAGTMRRARTPDHQQFDSAARDGFAGLQRIQTGAMAGPPVRRKYSTPRPAMGGNNIFGIPPSSAKTGDRGGHFARSPMALARGGTSP